MMMVVLFTLALISSSFTWTLKPLEVGDSFAGHAPAVLYRPLTLFMDEHTKAVFSLVDAKFLRAACFCHAVSPPDHFATCC